MSGGPGGIWSGMRKPNLGIFRAFFMFKGGVFHSFKLVENLHLTFHFSLQVVFHQLFPNELWDWGAYSCVGVTTHQGLLSIIKRGYNDSQNSLYMKASWQ